MEEGWGKESCYRLPVVTITCVKTRLLPKNSNSISMIRVGDSEEKQRMNRRTAPFPAWAWSFLFITLSIGLPFSLQAQTKAPSFTVRFTETPLREALAHLKSQHEIKLAYDDRAIADIRITRAFENLSLPAAIKELLANTDLVYRILGNDKVLIRRQALAEQSTETPGLQTLSGRVVDPQTGEGLAFATITTLDGKRGTIADEKGAFVFELSDQQHQVRVQYLGYQGKDVSLEKGGTKLVVGLYPKPQEIPSITIIERLPLVRNSQADGGLSIRSDALFRLPSFAGGVDLFRNLQLLPGISAHDDLSAELKIRGGKADENMIILDGISLYKVDHYFGVFSAMNPNVIEEVTLYKNSYPVEYGGRLSGLVEMNTTDVLQQPASGQVGLDLLTTNASFVLPLSTNMSILLGGRVTNNSLGDSKILNLLQQEQQSSNVANLTNLSTITRNSVIGIAPDFRFYDINAKWAWQVQPSTRLTASYFQGFDEFSYSYQEIFKNRIGMVQLVNEETNQEVSNWKNSGISLQWEQDWTTRLHSHINVAVSRYETATDIQRLFTQRFFRNGELANERSQLKQTKNDIESRSFNWKNIWQINSTQQLKFGYHFVQDEVAFDISAETGELLARSDKALQNAFYGEYKSTIFEKLKIAGALRLTHYDATQQFYLSPRFTAQYNWSGNGQLKTSWSRNQQFSREIYHEDRFGRTFEFWSLAKEKGFPVATSEQFMLGGNVKGQGWELDLELYTKSTDGMIEHAQVQNGRDRLDRPSQRNDFRFFEGDRLTRGIDILLKKTSRQYEGWLAYTLSKTTLEFPAIARGTPFPSADDRRHQLKWVNQYKWKKWDFSMNYVFSSGTPYTDISLLDELSQNRTNISPEDRISYLEDYHRVDVGANYNFTLWGGKARIGGSIFNVLDRNNVKQRQYIYSVAETRSENASTFNTVLGTELQLLDFTPNLNFAFSF